MRTLDPLRRLRPPEALNDAPKGPNSRVLSLLTPEHGIYVAKNGLNRRP